jgi:hypothetical protein
LVGPLVEKCSVNVDFGCLAHVAGHTMLVMKPLVMSFAERDEILVPLTTVIAVLL